jgi:hypothetical protein
MGKVGRFVVDAKAGAYCQVVLDSGDKLLVNHDKGGFKGGMLSVARSKWLGLASEPLFEVDLDSGPGKAALARLTEGIDATSARATPLGAFAELIKDSKDVQDAVTRCRELIGRSGAG